MKISRVLVIIKKRLNPGVEGHNFYVDDDLRAIGYCRQAGKYLHQLLQRWAGNVASTAKLSVSRVRFFNRRHRHTCVCSLLRREMEHYLVKIAELAGLAALSVAAIIHAVGYVKYVWSKK